MLQFTNNDEKLTAEEIRAKYPDGWVGLRDVKYEEDGMTVKRAIVVCYDKVCKQIDLMYLNGDIEYRLKTKESIGTNLTMLSIPQLIE